MFYFLSKAIDFLVMPLSILFALLTYAAFSKNNNRRKQVIASTLLILFFISNSYLVTKVFNWWEPRAVNINELTPVYDVGVLLSGGLISGQKPMSDHASLGKHGDRILQVYQLYKTGKIKRILITGTSADTLLKAGKGESRLAANMMIEWGVPPADILLEEKARNTRENALFTGQILKEKYPEGRFLLVTSAFHMRRSLACFRKVGLEVDPFPSDFYGGYNKITLKNGVVPNPAAISSFSNLWHEMIGFVVYKFVGYC